MLSRRILRIKTLNALYAHLQSERGLSDSEKELFFSIGKTYDLYFYLIRLIIDISDYANSRIELALQKRIPTQDDLNPNTRFVQNRMINFLRNNTQINNFLNNKKLSWVNHPELIKNLYNLIREADYFNTYMANPDSTFEHDQKFVLDIINKTIADYEPLFEILEEQSIFWNSEADFVISHIAKAVKSINAETPESFSLIDLHEDKDDAEFVKRLFRTTVNRQEENKVLIREFTENWDVERIAFMDLLIMQMAINELTEFQNIPKKVTLNEYIDIAKLFSTPNSSQFINGILDKIVIKLTKEKKIIKQGRGLVGES